MYNARGFSVHVYPSLCLFTRDVHFPEPEQKFVLDFARFWDPELKTATSLVLSQKYNF